MIAANLVALVQESMALMAIARNATHIMRERRENSRKAAMNEEDDLGYNNKHGMQLHFQHEFPICIVSPNIQQHWTKQRKRNKTHQGFISAVFNSLQVSKRILMPCHILLIRKSSRKFDEDNLVAAFKWVKDAIANHFIPGLQPGRADGDKRLTWEYAQEYRHSKEGRAIQVCIYCAQESANALEDHK